MGVARGGGAGSREVSTYTIVTKQGGVGSHVIISSVTSPSLACRLRCQKKRSIVDSAQQLQQQIGTNNTTALSGSYPLQTKLPLCWRGLKAGVKVSEART